jgi:K(+)-stimulated pyrophosphate-energized sodium pump
VMNLVSLLIATSVVRYYSNVGLRAGVAIAAVVIVVGAVVISKRRSHGLGDEAPASAETEAATAPAVPGPTTAPDSTVGTVPPARAHEAANGNGHVRTIAPDETAKPE